jgi:hypothetical protein
MKTLVVGGRELRIVTAWREGECIAHAERTDTGDSFGIACRAASEAEAIARVTTWLEWQHEHEAALESLQQAERAYHRAVAGVSLAASGEAPEAAEIQREALEQVEAARLRLDEVRGEQPGEGHND